MELFFANPENIQADEIILDDFERKHALNVLRKSPGEPLAVTDGVGNLFRTTIISERPQVRLKINGREHHPLPRPKLILAVGFIRPNRLEFILEKGTELGVSAFYLIQTAYANYATGNTDRWQKILRQAMKQSLQYYLPQVQVFASLHDFLTSSEFCTLRLAAIDRNHPPLLDVLNEQFNAKPESVCLAIGPEGGFNPEEVDLFQEYGFHAVSLGKSRLRTETAALSGISIIRQFIH